MGNVLHPERVAWGRTAVRQRGRACRTEAIGRRGEQAQEGARND